MRFLTLLKSGISVEYVVQDFVTTLLKNSWDQDAIDLALACDFVNEILAAIGLTCNMIPEQILNNTYIWPVEQIPIYNFHCVEIEFKKLEQFLYLLCISIDQHNQLFQEEQILFPDKELEPPLAFLVDLLAIWCNAYKQLQKFEEFQTNKRLEEPFARINFHLLLGVHELRKIYRSDLRLMDRICDRLYSSAINGLFYKQPHDMIFAGFLNVISKDYDLFLDKSTKSKNFFFEAFSVEINSSTHLKLYQELQKMLVANDASSNEEQQGSDDGSSGVVNSDKLNILIDVLIEPSMLQVYYTRLVTGKAKTDRKIQQETLKFLNVLQSKLLTLDCFSREFFEAILQIIFKKDPTITKLASNLYINMMRRRFPQQILNHILNFYVEHFGSTEHMNSCIDIIYENFHFVLTFINFLEIITDTNTVEIIRLCSAHMLVKVFEIKLKEKDNATKKEIEHLLQILPEIFENLQCQTTIGILLQVFFKVSIEKLQKPTIDNFVHYAVGVFTHIEIDLQFPLLLNIFSIFHKCISFTRDWQHLELINDHLIVLYQGMIKELMTITETEDKGLLTTNLTRYNSLLKRLNIVLKTKYDLLDIFLLEIIKNISKYFVFNDFIQNVVISEKSFIDLYALEICLSGIIKLTKLEAGRNQNYTFNTEAQELFEYLWSHLQNMDVLLKLPLVRIKTYFSCFLLFLTYLPFELESNVYHQLIQILIQVNFKTKSFDRKLGNEKQQLHPMLSVENQRLMLRQFIEMHKVASVEINTNMVWKLCIYYEMSQHPFNKDLKYLLKTLAQYRLNIYKNIMPVLIYNLYNQIPALNSNKIKSLITKHIDLIDNDIRLESNNLFKVHVVLLVLQIIEKALTVQRIKTETNRLEALKYLHLFIEDLDLNLLQAKQLIDYQLNNLQKHLLNKEEVKFFESFRKLLLEDEL